MIFFPMLQQHEGLRAQADMLWCSYFSEPCLSLWESGLETCVLTWPAFYRRGHCWWITGNNQDNQLLCCLYRDTIEPVSNTYSAMYLSCSWTTGHFIMLYFDQTAKWNSVSWSEPARLVAVSPTRRRLNMSAHVSCNVFKSFWLPRLHVCLNADNGSVPLNHTNGIVKIWQADKTKPL